MIKKRKKRTRVQVEAILPQRIIEAINESIFEENFNLYCFRFCAALYLKHMKVGIPLFSFISVSRNYIIKVTGCKNGEAAKIYKALKNALIIEAENNGFYACNINGTLLGKKDNEDRLRKVSKNDSKGHTRRMRFNQTLAFSNTQIVSFEALKQSEKEVRTYTKIERQAFRNLRELELHFPCKTFEEIKNFSKGFCSTKLIQSELKDKIKYLHKIPKYGVFQLLDSNGDVVRSIPKEEIESYLQNGFRLFGIKRKNRISKNYFLSTYSQVLAHKTKELANKITCDIYHLVNLNQERVYRNGKNDRLETPLVRLKSQIIAYCTVYNEKVFGIDMVNSQPVLFASQLRQALQIIDSGKDYRPSKEIDSIRGVRDILVKLLKDVPKYSEFRQEIERFCNACFNGFIYEEIASWSEYNKSLKRCSKEEKERLEKGNIRDNAKTAVFHVFFGERGIRNKDVEMFQNAFPYILWTINGIKYEFEKKALEIEKTNPELYKSLYANVRGRIPHARKAGSNMFSNCLQKLESYLFVEQIQGRLTLRRIWYSGKHDSILTIESKIKRVLKIMRYFLDKEIGKGNYQLKLEWFEISRNGEIEKRKKPIIET